jgi:hypothetical protein
VWGPAGARPARRCGALLEWPARQYGALLEWLARQYLLECGPAVRALGSWGTTSAPVQAAARMPREPY